MQLPTHFPLATPSSRNTAQGLPGARAGVQKAETHCSSKFHGCIFTRRYFKILTCSLTSCLILSLQVMSILFSRACLHTHVSLCPLCSQTFWAQLKTCSTSLNTICTGELAVRRNWGCSLCQIMTNNFQVQNSATKPRPGGAVGSCSTHRKHSRAVSVWSWPPCWSSCPAPSPALCQAPFCAPGHPPSIPKPESLGF